MNSGLHKVTPDSPARRVLVKGAVPVGLALVIPMGCGEPGLVDEVVGKKLPGRMLEVPVDKCIAEVGPVSLASEA